MKNRPLLLVLLVASLSYAAYVLRSVARPAPPPGPLAAGFAGSRACAACHADIFGKHAASHHALALHEAADFDRQESLPEPLWIPDPALPASYRITRQDGVLGVEAQAGAASRWQPIRWAFGSGNQGMTPVGITPDGRYVESALTFYRRSGWDFTPGFLVRPPAERREMPTGDAFSADEAFECFNCHATGVGRSPHGPVLEGAQYGVQCERCHGAGEKHVREAGAGRPRGNIEVPGPSAPEVVRFCATCHRSDPPAGVPVTAPVVTRFAPVGFQRSRCYLESGRTFSCVSCHDPHANASKDPESYRAVCTGCHGGKPALVTCPEKPQGDCVACHMPKQIIQRNSIFTDHWIRVVRRSKRTASRQTPGAAPGRTP